jgi:hypothetical protein
MPTDTGPMPKNPPECPGIYPVTLHTGERTCARWDTKQWFLWVEWIDPPEWDPIEWSNTYVVDWKHP